MEKFVVGLADDMQNIHDMIEKFVNGYDELIQLEHFYFTSEVEDYLYDNPEGIDMLFLDVLFEGSTSGIEALPTIREYAPDLPIYLFTGEDIEVKTVMAMCEKYNIELVKKPVEEAEILTKIMLVKKNYDNYKKVYEKLDEYSQYIDLIEKDNERLILEKAIEQANVQNTINEINARIEANKQIPKSVYTLVQEVFPNLEFAPNVLLEMLGKNFDKGIYKILRPLNDGANLPAGAKKKHFVEWGVNNLYEYRLSLKSRVFVQEVGGQKPLIYAIDYNHDKH